MYSIPHENYTTLLLVLESRRYELKQWSDSDWQRHWEHSKYAIWKEPHLATHVIKTHDIDTIKLVFQKMPLLKCDPKCLMYALLHFNESSPVYQFVLENLKKNRTKVTLVSLKLPTESLSVELLQKACRAGVILDSVASLLRDAHKQILKNDNKKRISVTKLAEEQHRLSMVIRYILIHCKVPEPTLFELVMRAHKAKDTKLLEIYKKHLTPAQIDEIAKTYPNGSALKQTFHEMNTTALKDFVAREIQPNGKLDNLLYQPPDGLIVKRNIRDYCNA